MATKKKKAPKNTGNSYYGTTVYKPNQIRRLRKKGVFTPQQAQAARRTFRDWRNEFATRSAADRQYMDSTYQGVLSAGSSGAYGPLDYLNQNPELAKQVQAYLKTIRGTPLSGAGGKQDLLFQQFPELRDAYLQGVRGGATGNADLGPRQVFYNARNAAGTSHVPPPIEPRGAAPAQPSQVPSPGAGPGMLSRQPRTQVGGMNGQVGAAPQLRGAGTRPDTPAGPGPAGAMQQTAPASYAGAQGNVHNQQFLQGHPNWAAQHPNQYARQYGTPNAVPGYGTGPGPAGAAVQSGTATAAGNVGAQGATQGGQPVQSFLPNTPAYESAQRDLYDQLQAALSQYGIQASQIPLEVQQAMARMGTDIGYANDALKGDLANRGIFTSGAYPQLYQQNIAVPYGRQAQDLAQAAAQQLADLSAQQGNAYLGYNQGIGNALLQRALEVAQNMPMSLYQGRASSHRRPAKKGRKGGKKGGKK